MSLIVKFFENCTHDVGFARTSNPDFKKISRVFGKCSSTSATFASKLIIFGLIVEEFFGSKIKKRLYVMTNNELAVINENNKW